MKVFWLLLMFAQAQQVPQDVHPESLNRLPLITRNQLDAEGQKLYDSYNGPNSKSLAGLQGPAGIRLYSSHLAVLNEPMNTYLRYNLEMPRRLAELAILVTAREFDSQFEWTAHEPVALKEGLDPEILDAVKFRKPVTGAPEKEAAIIAFGRELFRDRKVRAETYAEMVRVFGQTAGVNITALMANYAFTAVMLTAFDQQVHEGRKPLLPIP